MAKSLAKSVTCGSCGAEVRAGSVFCHKCGNSVVVEPLPPAILKPTTGITNGHKERGERTNNIAEPEPPPVMVPVEPLEHVSRPPASPSEIDEAAPKTRLERVRSNKRVQKVVEVEWVEREGTSVGYVLTAVVLAIIAGLLVAAALYMR